MSNESIARFKICIFGDGGVGKTSLTQRFTTGVFQDHYAMTIGMDFFVKKIDIDGKTISLQIWDFAGEDRFRFLLPSCIIGARGIFFMYDTTRYFTLKNLHKWISVYNEAKEKQNQNVPVILLGSKLDLEHKRAVNKKDGIEIAEFYGLLDYIEFSSKTGENVEKIFEKIGRVMLEKILLKVEE